jgi:hypothetical protein
LISASTVRLRITMRDVLIPALCAPAGQTAMAATTTPAKTSHARAVMKESQAAR